MPVHLTGRMCEMNKIMRITKKCNLKVIEDCAQSIGSIYDKAVHSVILELFQLIHSKT